MIVSLLACSMGLEPLVADQDEALDAVPVEQALQGRTFELDLTGIAWIEPAGLGDALAALDMSNLLVHVADEAEGQITLAVALSDGDGGQDACEPVHAFPAADFSNNPRFQVETAGMDITLGGQPAAFQDLYLAGIFDPAGDAWDHGRLSTLLDVRDLSQVFDDRLDACELAEALDGTCEPCADGVEACIPVSADSAYAWEIDADFDVTVDGDGC